MTMAEDRVVADGVARRIGWRDHVWLTWHQQARPIVAVTLLCVVLVVALTYAARGISLLPNCDGLENCRYYEGSLEVTLADTVLRGVTLLPLVVALFLGVPAVAREFEGRTGALTWGQGVTPVRWLVGRLVSLAVLTVVLSGAVSIAAMRATRTLHDVAASGFESEFGTRSFELLVPLTVAYSLFGLVLGVVTGIVLRQVLPAIAITTIVLVASRVFVAFQWRPRFVEPEGVWSPPADSLVLVPNAWEEPGGRLVEGWGPCGNLSDDDLFDACLETFGGRPVSIFQPPERLSLFHGLEFGVFAAVTVALVVLGFALMSRQSWVAHE